MDRDAKRQPKKHKPYTDLSDLIDIHRDEKCFVLGAGPSIAFQDLSSIFDHVVISTNSSILLTPWDKGVSDRRYWISNDSLCLQWTYFWKNVIRSHCHKFVRTSWRKYDDKIFRHGFRYFAPRKVEKIPLQKLGQRLCSTSSVPTAIELAILTGCNQIYLLGIDHRMIHGNSHFWQFWPKEKWPQRKDKGKNFRPEQKHQLKVFQQNLDAYVALKELADREGREIHNCGTRSIVEAFPMLSLDDALR